MTSETPAHGSPEAGATIIPVIMSGGSGTRLWPLSTDEVPKQFHSLASDRTLIQDTVLRFGSEQEGLRFLNPVVICNVRHGELVVEQLRELSIEPSAVVLEPFGRNTAAVAAIAARLAHEIDPEALVLLLPADHVVSAPEGFRAAVSAAAEVARGHIVTFGLEPTGPETGYGYIERGEPVAEGVFRAASFAEKPDRETAARYVSAGTYDWNGGIFLFAPRVLADELQAHRPDIAEAAAASLDAAEREGPFITLDRLRFAACPSESLDYAVMEKTERAAVAPCRNIGWADVGSWSELWRLGPRDDDGNLLHGTAVVLDSRDSLVWASHRVVAAIGVEDVVVVETADAVLILPKSRAQDVKKIVEQLREHPSLRREPVAAPAGS